jgi:CRP-like cAMP-binding protein
MNLKPSDERTLRKCRLFAALDENDFKLLTQSHRTLELTAGQPLFHQGTPAEAFFVILEGWVVIFRDQANGNRVVIHLFGPGDSFAEALLSADDVLYPVSAEAASRSRVARFDIKTFRDHIAQSPRLALAVIAAVFKQLRGLVDQIEHHSEWSPRRRIAGFLLRMCRSEGGACRFELPLEQQLIAARLSMTPWTFSRELNRLGALGVEARRGQIVIHDAARLERFVSGEGE